MADDPASCFAEMSERIMRLRDGDFAGAVVIVPPGGGPPIEFLMTDPNPDLVVFWATTETRVQVRKNEALQSAEQPTQWRR